jgi:hypothetical protein
MTRRTCPNASASPLSRQEGAQTKNDERHDQAPDDSPMAWVELWTVDRAVDEARADPAEVAHADHHRKRHAALDITTCGPTCPSDHDRYGGEHTTGGDDRADI